MDPLPSFVFLQTLLHTLRRTPLSRLPRSFHRVTLFAGQSKLANILFTYEMARRLQPGNSLSGGSSSSITVNALHPGIVRTELWRYTVFQPLTLMATPFTLTPEQVIMPHEPSLARPLGAHERAVRRGPDPV